MTDALWKASAGELAMLYEAQVVTPSDVLESVLGRLETVGPKINAVIARNDAAARAASAASTQRWAAGAPLGPLDGVPFTVKDNIPADGLPTSWGSAAFRAIAPAGDELPVARLRAAGAVLIGKTNVPEFTSQGYTSNTVFGTTRNPWNTDLTPGGSSGGAVAAVAAGIGPFALGTDGGGSIRRPASHTGLLGLKPSLGRVPRCDGLPAILLDYEVIGPIARTVGDLVMVMSVIARPDPCDPASASLPAFGIAEPGPCRILYVPRFADHPVDPEITRSTDALARALNALGHVVETGEAPFDVETAARIQTTVSQAGLAWLGRDFGVAPVSQSLRDMAGLGMEMPAMSLFSALDAATALRRRLGAFFSDYAMILTPAAAALPWPATETHPPEIGGQPVGPRGHAVFTAFANIAGLPGISVPGPRSASGLPIGAQLVGPVGADGLVLGVARQLMTLHPDYVGWPSIARWGLPNGDYRTGPGDHDPY